jgi:hypothetical protein
MLIEGHLVVLADDVGQRAVPVWLLRGDQAGGGSLSQLIDEPDGVTVTAGVPEELGARLLRAAGATVTGVDIEMTEAGAGPVVFRGEIRTDAVSQRAGLRLEVLTRARLVKGERDDGQREARAEDEQRCATVSGSNGWARQELTAMVSGDAELIRFGITLTGPGLVALRSPELAAGSLTAA